MSDIQKNSSQGGSFRQEVRTKTADYVLAAFGFVTGLAWNEAVKALIEQFFPLHDNTAWAKLIYALFITVVFVVISVSVMRALKKEA
ncbi:MAG: hypothetical protein HY979_02740 [Candidatus Magasanikbacteria bacterium]|nr:hypothetical protein [Candidatus Magasanikbacteria bacterium]